MKITNKDVCMFTGGAVIGAAVCGVTVVYKFIKSDTFGPVIVKTLADKIVDSVVEKPRYVSYNRSKYVSYRGPNQVSYKSYYFNTDIIFETRKDAEDALTDMVKIAKNYGQVTVCDLYEIAGLTADYKANEYGWTSLGSIVKAPIHRVRNGYTIDLPKPAELTK